jgi:protein SCO1/2
MMALRSVVLTVLALVVAGCAHKEMPAYGKVPPFALTDQDGKAFTRETLAGQVWAAAFIFTRCPSACPRVTRAMQGVELQAKMRNLPLHLVSFSVDPEYDTPAVLRRYGTEFRADFTTWSFVTGDSAAIKRMAEQGLKIAVDGKADPSKPDFGITHGTQLALVDGKGEIRGYYATSDEEALARLVDDAQTLR